MTPIEWAALVLSVIGEVGKLAAAGVEASQEQMAEAQARMQSALEALRGTRTTVDHDIDGRHADAHAQLEALAAHPDTPPSIADGIRSALSQLGARLTATPLPAGVAMIGDKPL